MEVQHWKHRRAAAAAALPRQQNCSLGHTESYFQHFVAQSHAAAAAARLVALEGNLAETGLGKSDALAAAVIQGGPPAAVGGQVADETLAAAAEVAALDKQPVALAHCCRQAVVVVVGRKHWQC